MAANLTNPGLVVCQILILLSCAILGCAQGVREPHIATEECPTFAAFNSFDQSQFQGSWFVSYQFENRKFLICQNFNFTSTSDATLDIEGYGTTHDCVLRQHKGVSYTRNPKSPGAMTWYWDHLGALTDHVTVLDTDYDNYAILVLCDDLDVLHLNYAVLLTRRENVPENAALIASYVDKIHRVVEPLLNLRRNPIDDHRCGAPCTATPGGAGGHRDQGFNVHLILGQN